MLAYLFVVLAVLLRVVAGTGPFATLGFGMVGASLLFFGSRMPRKQFLIPWRYDCLGRVPEPKGLQSAAHA